MNNKEIKIHINNAIHQTPMLDFDDLVHMPLVKMVEHDFITRQLEKPKKRYFRQISVVFTCCIVLLLCISGWFVQYKVPDSTITLDVNPSIQIVTNKQNHILSINAINEDGKKVMEDLNSGSSDLHNMISELIVSMVSNGYLNADRNVIMVSVENTNIEKADQLAVELDQVIRTDLEPQNLAPQVLRQTFTKDKSVTALAKQYHLSVGKLNVIQQILSNTNAFSVDTLAHKSLTELLDISKKYSVDLSQTVQFDDDSSATDVISTPAATRKTEHSPNSVKKDNTHENNDASDEQTRTENDSSSEDNKNSQSENSNSSKKDSNDKSSENQDKDSNKEQKKKIQSTPKPGTQENDTDSSQENNDEDIQASPITENQDNNDNSTQETNNKNEDDGISEDNSDTEDDANIEADNQVSDDENDSYQSNLYDKSN